MKTNRNQSNILVAFTAALKTARANGNKLTQKEAANIALATIAKMFTDDNNPINLSPQQRDELKMIFYPKTEYRMNVIKAILKASDCTLDSTTQELLTGLLTPAQLEKKLTAAQEETPAVDWSKMVNDQEPLSSNADQGDADDDDEGADDNDGSKSAPAKGK